MYCHRLLQLHIERSGTLNFKRHLGVRLSQHRETFVITLTHVEFLLFAVSQYRAEGPNPSIEFDTVQTTALFAEVDAQGRVSMCSPGCTESP